MAELVGRLREEDDREAGGEGGQLGRSGHINDRGSVDVRPLHDAARAGLVEVSPGRKQRKATSTGRYRRKHSAQHDDDEDGEDGDQDEDDDDEAQDGYRRQSRAYREASQAEWWREASRPEGVEHENWFLLDYKKRWDLRFHARRYRRRAWRGARAAAAWVVGLPWHSIRTWVVFLLFVASLALFMSVSSPDEEPKTHMAAVSQAMPLISSFSFSFPSSFPSLFLSCQFILSFYSCTPISFLKNNHSFLLLFE